MADSVATRVARHRAKKRAKDVTRLTLEVDRAAVTTLRLLCRAHGKTQRQFIELAIHAADSLLAGRLRVTKEAAQSTPRVIIQQRPVAPAQPTGNTNAPATPENAPTPPLCEPEQVADDNIDARIRAAASMES